MKKRILSLVLVLSMLCAFVPVIAVAATGTQYGDYLYYQVNSDNTAVTITDCSTSATEIVIPSEIDGLPVTSIGDQAFYNCSSLTSVVIPNSVTGIGSYAFRNCTSLESIVIPDRITSIGILAFYNCSSLTSIVIPGSVTSIGRYAFDGCSSLTNIDVSLNNSTYSSLDGVVFNKDKTELILCPEGKSGSYTIPDSVTSIGSYTFYYCRGLTSIEIPDSVTSIGDYVFYGCSSLTSIEIPDSVTSIGSGAFSGCSSLTSIVIPDSVTSIGSGAFEYCTGLTSVTIGSGVTSIGDWAFLSCSSLTNIDVSLNNSTYSSLNGVVFNKDKTELILCPGGKSGSYTIPDSVTSIGSYTFQECRSLTSIEIPDSVTSIGIQAFYKCSSLESIVIPDSVTSIGGWAFSSCSSLESVTMGSGVTSIGSGAFLDCSSLTSIVIPDSVTSIGDRTFFLCRSLESVTIGNSITSIGSQAFSSTAYYNDENNWESGVLYINDCLIEANSDNLPAEYEIKSETRCIADYAFSGCTNLESITIGSGVTSIGSGAFLNCNSVATVTGYTHSSAEMLAKYLDAEFISLGSTDYQEITVTNSQELLAAIGSYRKITMSPGTYEISTQLNMHYISDLEIVGGDGVEIISLDPDNPVLNLQYSDNITFDGIVMGHYTKVSYGCGVYGYVILASNCENLTVNNCDLFGCGLNGLSLSKVTGLSADNTIIRDCMLNIIDLYDSDNIQLTNCVMKNNAYYERTRGSYKAINGNSSSVKFVDCEFSDNLNYEFYDESKISVQLENCNFTRNIWQAAEVVATADAEVNNNTIAVYVDTENLNPNLNLFTAIYDNTGALDGYEKMENGSAEISAENVSVVKVFAWESLESMKPLCEAKSIEL